MYSLHTYIYMSDHEAILMFESSKINKIKNEDCNNKI